MHDFMTPDRRSCRHKDSTLRLSVMIKTIRFESLISWFGDGQKERKVAAVICLDDSRDHRSSYYAAVEEQTRLPLSELLVPFVARCWGVGL